MRSILRRNHAQEQSGEVSSALRMTAIVRLQIFACEVIVPAVDAFLADFSLRLDQVTAKRHTVDFEAAKAWSYWTGSETDALVARAMQVLGDDGDIQRQKESVDAENILIDRYLEGLVREKIGSKSAFVKAQINSRRDIRLNVQ